MKKYTFKEFLKGEFSILVSGDTIKRTLEQLSKTGLKWYGGTSLNEFISTYHGYMCLVVRNSSLGWSNVLSNWTPLITIDQLTIEKDDLKNQDFIGQCVESDNEELYTVGKLYYFKNGVTILSNGDTSVKYLSIEDFNERNTIFQMIEIKEVKRKAEVGEYVKVVNPQNIPKTNGAWDYDKGSILKIIKIDRELNKDGDCHYSDRYNGYLYDSEYVVLEGCQDFKEDKIEVGDMVEIINEMKNYYSYSKWFSKTNNLEYKSHYVPYKRPSKTKQYKVVCKGKYYSTDSCPDRVYCIQDLDTTQVFLMRKDGIKKC